MERNQIEPLLRQRNPVLLELGCGPRKRLHDAIGIDSLPYPGVDLVGDAAEVLRLFPDGSVDGVAAFHFLEHVDDAPTILNEIARVLRVGGWAHLVVPHFSNPYFYSDPTHRSTWGLYSFAYLARSRLFRREVPDYVCHPALHVVDIRLRFISPFIERRLLRHALNWIMNVSRYTQEFYEENLCYLLPCYEVDAQLVRVLAVTGSSDAARSASTPT